MAQNCPKLTPWGRRTFCEKIAEGIKLVSTSMHGGYWISDARLEALPEWAKKANNRTAKRAMDIGQNWPRNWWEEGVDWCVPVLAFQAEFRQHWAMREHPPTGAQVDALLHEAEAVLQSHHPEAYAARRQEGTTTKQEATPCS